MALGEALRTVNYSLNRVQSVYVHKTPSELWKCKKQNLAHFNIWSCPPVVRIYDLELRKSYFRSISYYFTGYM